MTTIATARQDRRNARLAAEADARARKLVDIIAAYDMLLGCEVLAGAHHSLDFDGFIAIDRIADYVDIAPDEIRSIVTDAQENMTSPTHKVLIWEHADKISAELVS